MFDEKTINAYKSITAPASLRARVLDLIPSPAINSQSSVSPQTPSSSQSSVSPQTPSSLQSSVSPQTSSSSQSASANFQPSAGSRPSVKCRAHTFLLSQKPALVIAACLAIILLVTLLPFNTGKVTLFINEQTPDKAPVSVEPLPGARAFTFSLEEDISFYIELELHTKHDTSITVSRGSLEAADMAVAGEDFPQTSQASALEISEDQRVNWSIENMSEDDTASLTIASKNSAATYLLSMDKDAGKWIIKKIKSGSAPKAPNIHK